MNQWIAAERHVVMCFVSFVMCEDPDQIWLESGGSDHKPDLVSLFPMSKILHKVIIKTLLKVSQPKLC